MYAFILHEDDGSVFFVNACYCLWDYTVSQLRGHQS